MTGPLDALFADLLIPGDVRAFVVTGEAGETGEFPSATKTSGPSPCGEPLAKIGEPKNHPGVRSPAFALGSPRPGESQVLDGQGLLPHSPDSPRSEPPSPATEWVSSSDPADSSAPWTGAEIAGFVTRRDRLMRRGLGELDAERIAEKLLRRDREGDDRNLCVECVHLKATGHCSAAAQSKLRDAHRLLQPPPLILQRCECFASAL